MYIDQYKETIEACRFCFMCRHLSPIGNVTFRESDTPRIRAAMTDALRHRPEQLADPEYIDTIYRSDLSGCCYFHCVKHFEENALNLAIRADMAEAGVLPENILALAKKYSALKEGKLSGKGTVLYFVDSYTAGEKESAAAFDKIMKKAGVSYMTLQGGCLGKALRVLGFRDKAKAAAKKFADLIKKSGAKTVVVSNPAAYDALVNDCKEYGIKLTAKVMHASEYLLTLKLSFKKKAGSLYYLESDFLKNYNNNLAFPRELLAKAGAKIVPFGTNNEESYSCGEGAVILPELHPELVQSLAEYVAARADDPKKDLIVVASPYTAIQLRKYTSLKIVTLEKLAEGLI